MQTLINKIEVIEHIAKNKKGDEVRIISKIEFFQLYRQGDVYLMFVPENWGMREPTKARQLVPGNSKGSRHLIEGDLEVFSKWDVPDFLFKRASEFLRVDRLSIVNELMSPAIRAKSAWKNKHPEHADFHNPAGSYISWSQLDARTMRRVKD